MRECTALCTIVIFIIQMTVFIHGEAILEVQMLTYRNPSGAAGDDHGSCDDRYINFGENWRCDTYFLICVKKSAGDSSINHCTYFYGQAGIYQNRNNIVFGKDMGKISNPIKVHLVGACPGSIRFSVGVMDKDWICDENIDRMSVVWTMKAARNVNQSKWSDTQFITGFRDIDATRLTVKYRLYCKENYYNTSCDVRCVASNGPTKNTLCDPATGAELCQPGWEGPDCDIVSDDCIGNNCTNEASCKDGNRQFTCICVPGFAGRYCEKNIDECASNPCLNDGSCVDKVDSFGCTCKPGYTGSTCSHNKCESGESPCMNKGTCFLDTRGEVRCNCPKTYTGEVCQREKCLDIVCQNLGICKDGICVCRQGYVGQLCDVKLCDNIPCMHGGTCKDGKCFCTRQYTGFYCTKRIDVRGPAYSAIQKSDHEGGDPPQSKRAQSDKTITPLERGGKTKANTNRGTKKSSSFPLTVGVMLAALMYSIP